MRHARFRFYAELNDFLAPDRRSVEFQHAFELPGSVKDMIESIGVPHTEVDLVLINDESAPFSATVNDGDRVSVFPAFFAIDISDVSLVRPAALPEARFVLDVHLGRLATYLRMAGFDTLYRNDYSDEQIAAIACQEQRIVLTADRGLLKRNNVAYGYFVRSRNPRQQLSEVLGRFSLFDKVAPFSRCLECNTSLVCAEKNDVVSGLPERIAELHTNFCSCRCCGRVYWKGSHYEHMTRFLDLVMKPSEYRCHKSLTYD
jgi:uncharacterized protein with PIN domain